MFKVGDKIKFVNLEKYLHNKVELNRPIRKKDEDIQKKIAGVYDEIIHIEQPEWKSEKLYYTSMPHGGLLYFLHERFETVNKIIELSDNLFKL